MLCAAKKGVFMANVLIVDDSKTAREMIVRLIEGLGIRCVVCETGDEGLKEAKSKVFDLILTDYNMPHMNGFEMAKMIKEDSLNVTTPIVCITSHTNESLKQQSKEFMITGWMIKPVKEDHLLSLIKRIIHE